MWNRLLSAVLVIAILGALGALVYVLVIPQAGETFTEFYILGTERKAADYPKELMVGKAGTVILGIINREYEVVSYRVEVRINSVQNNEVEEITLEHDGKWENEVSFTPEVAGEKQEVQFLLYKNGETEPCLKPLRLWIDVAE